MNSVTLRRLLRWGHILAGVYLGTFVFSPLLIDPVALVVAQATIVAMGLSGLALWQQPRLMRLLSRRRG